jgi:hypothetical protein
MVTLVIFGENPAPRVNRAKSGIEERYVMRRPKVLDRPTLVELHYADCIFDHVHSLRTRRSNHRA